VVERSLDSWKKHDSIINTVASALESQGFFVKTNPNQKKDNPVERKGGYTYYPDLFVIENEKVTRVYEVETEDSITDEEAENQWKPYSDGAADFYLVVPEKSLSKAKELVNKYNIDVKDYYTFN